MPRPPLDTWQYRLSATEAPGAIPVGTFWLELGPGLTPFPVQDGSGRPVGVLLGQVIDLARRQVIDGPWRATAVLGGDVDGFAREVLWSLAGNFLWIFTAGETARIYPDCSAQVPCVWDRAAGMAASSAHAMFDDATYEQGLDRALFDALGVDGENWYPAGLTAHRGVERLQPCHYLDLADWTTHRFWSAAEIKETNDPKAAAGRLADFISAQIEALSRGPLRAGLGLTAGRETRTLLACARPWLEDIDTVTVVGTDRHMMDSVMARRIAKEFGIRHRELPRTNATPEQRARFIRRVGHCYADSNSWFHPSVWPIAGSHVLVGGIGGEVGRGFFWRAGDRDETEITAQMLVSRLGLPQLPQVVDAVSRWHGALPRMTAFQVLDQAYLDLRLGPWHGVQFCGNPTIIRIAPLLAYPCVEILLSLPADWKRRSGFVDEIIATRWPELLRIPFNSLGWLRDRLIKVQKVARNPGVIWKRLRKMRG